MLHDTEAGVGAAFQPFTSTLRPAGISGFRFTPVLPPMMLVLCETGEEFLHTSTWPSRSPSTIGSNWQHGWSISTFSAGLTNDGWTGRGAVPLLAGMSQTITS